MLTLVGSALGMNQEQLMCQPQQSDESKVNDAMKNSVQYSPNFGSIGVPKRKSPAVSAKQMVCFAFGALMLAGCATSKDATQERGPDGTLVYLVKIESSEPGARIDVNGEPIGKSPMTLKVFGDRDGTFHNFGSYDFIVKAFPPGAGRDPQTKIYKTGALFAREDKIPGRIYFDFGSSTSTQNP